MTLLASFQTLLYRYTGQTDIVVGTDIANRTYAETEALIGFFINLLVLSTRLDGEPSFMNVLRSVHAMLLEAYTYQDTPFEMLVEQLQLSHITDRVPLVQVLFVLQNIPHVQAQSQHLTLAPIGRKGTTAKFDLALFMQENADNLSGVVVYNPDLFNESTIATMMERFVVLMQSIVDNPDQSISLLDFYSEAEKTRQTKRIGLARSKLKTTKNEGIFQS